MFSMRSFLQYLSMTGRRRWSRVLENVFSKRLQKSKRLRDFIGGRVSRNGRDLERENKPVFYLTENGALLLIGGDDSSKRPQLEERAEAASGLVPGAARHHLDVGSQFVAPN
jgi:hypothetical protein